MDCFERNRSHRLRPNLPRRTGKLPANHYDGVVMGAMASQITSLTIVCSIVYSGTDQRKHQSSVSLAGLCAGNSPGTGEFLAQRTSYVENVSIWWRHHVRNGGVWRTDMDDIMSSWTDEGRRQIGTRPSATTILTRNWSQDIIVEHLSFYAPNISCYDR